MTDDNRIAAIQDRLEALSAEIKLLQAKIPPSTTAERQTSASLVLGMGYGTPVKDPVCYITGNPLGTDTRPIGPDGEVIHCSCHACMCYSTGLEAGYSIGWDRCQSQSDS